MSRYEAMFARLANEKAGAFIPFCVLGDPTPDQSLQWLHALVEGGADALELAIPFSDPVADGPTIQAADVRALEAGTTPARAFDVVERFRAKHPGVPVGFLLYANLVEARGRDQFYQRCAAVGVDSVLVADVPTVEAQPFVDSAVAHGIDPVLIATPNARHDEIAAVAQFSRGYTYVVTRRGVTGAEARAGSGHDSLITALNDAGAPPSVLGFGISAPDHVRDALATGAAGAISGSAVVSIIAEHLGDDVATANALREFTARMKAATGR